MRSLIRFDEQAYVRNPHRHSYYNEKLPKSNQVLLFPKIRSCSQPLIRRICIYIVLGEESGSQDSIVWPHLLLEFRLLNRSRCQVTNARKSYLLLLLFYTLARRRRLVLRHCSLVQNQDKEKRMSISSIKGGDTTWCLQNGATSQQSLVDLRNVFFLYDLEQSIHLLAGVL